MLANSASPYSVLTIYRIISLWPNVYVYAPVTVITDVCIQLLHNTLIGVHRSVTEQVIHCLPHLSLSLTCNVTVDEVST